jgi:hypothetical protein
VIEDLDIIITDAGDITLVVPGEIVGTNTILELYNSYVVISHNNEPFVKVSDVDNSVIDKLAEKEKIALMEVTDLNNPPLTSTHTCSVQDYR